MSPTRSSYSSAWRPHGRHCHAHFNAVVVVAGVRCDLMTNWWNTSTRHGQVEGARARNFSGKFELKVKYRSEQDDAHERNMDQMGSGAHWTAMLGCDKNSHVATTTARSSRMLRSLQISVHTPLCPTCTAMRTTRNWQGGRPEP